MLPKPGLVGLRSEIEGKLILRRRGPSYVTDGNLEQVGEPLPDRLTILGWTWAEDDDDDDDDDGTLQPYSSLHTSYFLYYVSKY